MRSDIINHLRQDPQCPATTMVDYYALPQSDDRAWPGRAAASRLPVAEMANTIEQALLADIVDEFGAGFTPDRFVPYVMMHEFEGLLFSDCTVFGQGIGRPELISQLQAVRDQFATPEGINDSPLTAPSKRVAALVSGDQKPLLGTLAALQIGLDAIRRECLHFRSWLEHLEAWPR